MSRRFDRGHQFSANDRLPYITDTHDLPIELSALRVEVVVTGLFAETTQTLRLFNPNPRDLEGNLCFPLPDGGVVCGYALDVGGQLVDGVVVPKEEARRILDAEIRKGIDPGLIEQVQGNVYRTRIYPLPALGTRTVKIVYVSELTVEGTDAAYHLPLGHAEDVDEVSLRVEIGQCPVSPALVGGIGNMSLHSLEQGFVAEAALTRGTPSHDLQIRLPRLPDHVTAVERFGDQNFFCISSHTAQAERPAPWTPARLAVLWDASGSRQDVSRDLMLLEALGRAWPRTVFDVRVLRNVVESDVHTFSMADGGSAALREFLSALPCDGGTHLAAVDFAELPHPDDEAWLLFSDGLSTMGSGLPATASQRVFAITGQANSDSKLLSHIAQRSGGAHVNLLRTTPESAAQFITAFGAPLRLERAAGCEDVHV